MKIQELGPLHEDLVMVLVDREGGATWWCGACGTTSIGRILPEARDPQLEAARLANGHIKRRHGVEE